MLEYNLPRIEVVFDEKTFVKRVSEFLTQNSTCTKREDKEKIFFMLYEFLKLNKDFIVDENLRKVIREKYDEVMDVQDWHDPSLKHELKCRFRGFVSSL